MLLESMTIPLVEGVVFIQIQDDPQLGYSVKITKLVVVDLHQWSKMRLQFEICKKCFFLFLFFFFIFKCKESFLNKILICKGYFVAIPQL